MKKTLLILALVVATLAMAACTAGPDELCENLSGQELQACCDTQHEGEPRVLCVGAWTWTEENGCTFECGLGAEEENTAATEQQPATNANPDTYCATVDDCTCGKSRTTGECTIGNVDAVDANDFEDCEDYCGGTENQASIQCVASECVFG